MVLQLSNLVDRFNDLQTQYGDHGYLPIYGAGELTCPRLMFIFMNPTGRNVSSRISWNGIRAPWLGTKQIWKLFNEIGVISRELLQTIANTKPSFWTPALAESLYLQVANSGVYITNFAKCTLRDARPIQNRVFNAYKSLLEEEIDLLRPEKIVTLGNQVSTMFLSKTISVSSFCGTEYETKVVHETEYKVYPTYYPVGQGQRNSKLARNRLLSIVNSDESGRLLLASKIPL